MKNWASDVKRLGFPKLMKSESWLSGILNLGASKLTKPSDNLSQFQVIHQLLHTKTVQTKHDDEKKTGQSQYVLYPF